MIPIIIVTHNNASTINRTISALMKTTFDFDEIKIFIIDNNSTDNTPYILNTIKDDRITVLFLKRNLGFPAAVILGLLHAKPTTYFALLNPDAIPTPYWLQRLYEVMENDPKIGIAQSLLVHPDGTIDSAGGFLNFLGYPVEVKKPLDSKPYSAMYAKGAAVLVRVSAYKEAGGFDPRFFFYYDETDLCARMRKKGYKVVVVPDSIVFHIGLGSRIKCKELFVLYYMERNRLFYIFKNEPFKLPLALTTALLGITKEKGIRRYVRKKAVLDFISLAHGHKLNEPFNPCLRYNKS